MQHAVSMDALVRNAYSPVDAREISDSELMLGLIAGDEDAFEVLHVRYRHLVNRTALRIVRDRGCAEEVTQDVFIAAWRARARFDPAQASLRPWFLTAARHRSIDALRRCHGTTDELTGEFCRWPQSDAVFDEAFQSMGHETLEAAIAKLPAPQAAVIRLVYWFGCTNPQTASILRLPISTVKGRLRLGVARMALLLQAQVGTQEVAA